MNARAGSLPSSLKLSSACGAVQGRISSCSSRILASTAARVASSGAGPVANAVKAPSRSGRAPWPWCGRASAAAEVTELEGDQRGQPVGDDSLGEHVDELGAELGKHHAVAARRDRVLGVASEPNQGGGGDRGEGVEQRRPRGSERPQQARAVVLRAEVRGHDRDYAPSTERGREHGNVGQRQGAEDRCQRLGEVEGEAAIVLEYLGASSAGQKAAPANTSATGWSSSSSAVTTPKLPPPPRSAQKSSGLLSASTRFCSPAGVTSSIARTLLQASPCARPSQPRPPPRVSPATPTLGANPATAREPVLARGVGDLAGQSARLDPGDPCGGIDADRSHPRGLQQHRAVDRPEGPGAVAGRLRGNAQPVLERELDHGADVVGAGRLDDHIGALVDRQVPGPAGVVPAGIARPGQRAGEPRAELGEVVRGRHRPTW